MKVVHPYGEKVRCPIVFAEVGRTKQSFKKECDINEIMRRFEKTGAITHLREHGQSYGFASAFDFREAMEIVARGKSMFEELPAKLRQRFDTPEAFLEFVQDGDNLLEMVELGLATARDPIVEGGTQDEGVPEIVPPAGSQEVVSED